MSPVAGARIIKAGKFKNLHSFRDFEYGRRLLPQVQALFKDKYRIEVAEIFCDLPAKAAILGMDKPNFMGALTERGDFSHPRFEDFTIAMEIRTVGSEEKYVFFFLRDAGNRTTAESGDEVAPDDFSVLLDALEKDPGLLRKADLLRAGVKASVRESPAPEGVDTLAEKVKPVLSVNLAGERLANKNITEGDFVVSFQDSLVRRITRRAVQAGWDSLFLCEKADKGFWRVRSYLRQFEDQEAYDFGRLIGEIKTTGKIKSGNRETEFFSGSSDSVIYASLSPDGKYIAATGLAYDFGIFDAAQKRPVFLQEKKDNVWSVSIDWSNLSEYLAVTDTNDTLRIFRVDEIPMAVDIPPSVMF